MKVPKGIKKYKKDVNPIPDYEFTDSDGVRKKAFVEIEKGWRCVACNKKCVHSNNLLDHVNSRRHSLILNKLIDKAQNKLNVNLRKFYKSGPNPEPVKPPKEGGPSTSGAQNPNATGKIHPAKNTPKKPGVPAAKPGPAAAASKPTEQTKPAQNTPGGQNPAPGGIAKPVAVAAKPVGQKPTAVVGQPATVVQSSLSTTAKAEPLNQGAATSTSQGTASATPQKPSPVAQKPTAAQTVPSAPTQKTIPANNQKLAETTPQKSAPAASQPSATTPKPIPAAAVQKPVPVAQNTKPASAPQKTPQPLPQRPPRTAEQKPAGQATPQKANTTVPQRPTTTTAPPKPNTTVAQNTSVQGAVKPTVAVAQVKPVVKSTPLAASSLVKVINPSPDKKIPSLGKVIRPNQPGNNRFPRVVQPNAVPPFTAPQQQGPVRNLVVIRPVTSNRNPDPPQRQVVDLTMAAKDAELLLKLDQNTSESMVGLEYLVELQDYEGEPSYHCVLCDKLGDPRTILIHLASTGHRIKFLDKHYPSVMKELGGLRYDKDARVAVMKVLNEISAAVEKHHGRLKPLVVQKAQYTSERMRYFTQILSGQHFSESVGPSFVNLVDKKRIADISRTVKLKADVKRTVAEVEAQQKGRTSEVHSREKEIYGRSRSRSRSPRGGRRPFRRSRSRSLSPRDRRRFSNDRPRRSPSPMARRRRSRTPERRPREDKEKMELCRTMQLVAVKEVELRYQDYELHPEKHPLYPAEWEAFWNRRYKELQQENKDPSTHDFKPEWIGFWTRRLKELFNDDVESARRDIKIKLGFPLDDNAPREKEPPKRERERSREPRKRAPSVEIVGEWSGDDTSRDPISKRNRRDRSPSNVSRDRISNRRGSRSPSRSTNQSKRRLSRSPSLDRRERNRELDRIIERHRGPSYSGDYDHYQSRKYEDRYAPMDVRNRSPSPAPPEQDDNEPLSIVGVLRILAALEDQLGSLGTKTLDLLAKALAMEKAKANSSDDLMMTEEYAVFFETIKEKLKGQLITGVLNKAKVGAVKKSIRKIAEVLHEISKKSKEAEATGPANSSNIKRTIVIKVAMDKAMIAQRIALALVTEKKTDVTPEQLEILINVFFEMLRKSKELNKLVTTQNYIDLLEEQKVQSVANKVDILGIIGNQASEASIERKSNKPVVKLDFNDPVDGELVEAKTEERRRGRREPADNDIEEADDEVDRAQNTDAFTDSDLKTLLQNFRDLSSDEQQHLIRHLRKMELECPERVDKLRKFVNFDGLNLGLQGKSGTNTSLSSAMAGSSKESLQSAKRSSDISGGDGPLPKKANRWGQEPPKVTAEEPKKPDVKIQFGMKKKETLPAVTVLTADDEDDDDDDYNFDDVVKAAARNVEGAGSKSTEAGGAEKAGEKKQAAATTTKEKRRSPSPETKQISETHSLIANIMGSLQKKATPAAKPGSSGNGAAAGVSTSLPFYQQQQQQQKSQSQQLVGQGNTNQYNNSYQEQILQQQQFANMYQQQQDGGGFMNPQQQHEQMMYLQQQQQQGNGNWWPNQNQMFDQQQQQHWGGQYNNNQYQNSNSNNYGNYY